MNMNIFKVQDLFSSTTIRFLLKEILTIFHITKRYLFANDLAFAIFINHFQFYILLFTIKYFKRKCLEM